MVRLNRDVVEHELRRLLNVIFVQMPVHATPQYLTSALSQLRRTLLDHPRDSDTTAVTARLPLWLDANVQIGPYERSLFYRLLDESDGGVITIRGGSGSGKSSAFQHIERTANAAADQLVWTNPYGLRRFFFVIDLQATCGRIQALRSADGTVAVDAVTILLQDIAGMLDTIFTRHFTHDAFRRLVDDALKFQSGSEHYTNLETAQAHLSRELDGRDTTTMKIADYIRLFNGLEESERVPVRLMLFTQLARALEREQRALVMVLDNIDPLPVVVQNKLVNILSTAVSSQMWRPLRVVVLTRISTAIHHLGVLNPVVVDHESVDPADMVLYRLTWFFLSMGTFPTFTEQPDEVRNAVVGRLFELWRHLVDTRGAMRRLLSAMAGTNIRNAFAYATAWCLSRRFTPDIYSAQILDEFQSHVQMLFGIHLVTELDATLGRIVDSQFSVSEIEQLRLAIYIDSPTVAIESQGVRLADAMLTLLDDLYLLGDRAKNGHDSIRHQACIIGRELLADTLTRPDAAQRVTWLLHLALSTAVKRLAALQPADETSVGQAVVGTFAARLRQVAESVDGAAHDRVTRLIDWIAETARRATDNPIAESDVARRMILRDDFDVTLRGRSGRAVFEPLTSRFQAAAILVNPSPGDPTVEPNALNVFALDRSSVAPAILRLLYLLAVRGKATVRELYSDLLWHGFSADEIYVALLRMAHINVRLIFAGLSDSNDDLDPWLKSDRSVYLSAAGRGYFSVVVQSPAYLQWAFSDIAEVRREAANAGVGDATSFLDRIQAALIGFEVSIARELAMLKATWDSTGARHEGDMALRRSLSAEEVSCQSVTADVFFRSYPAFIYALFSHFMKLSRDSSRNVTAITDVRNAATKWRSWGRQWLDEHAEYFRRRYEPWQERLDIANSDVEAILATQPTRV